MNLTQEEKSESSHYSQSQLDLSCWVSGEEHPHKWAPRAFGWNIPRSQRGEVQGLNAGPQPLGSESKQCGYRRRFLRLNKTLESESNLGVRAGAWVLPHHRTSYGILNSYQLIPESHLHLLTFSLCKDLPLWEDCPAPGISAKNVTRQHVM